MKINIKNQNIICNGTINPLLGWNEIFKRTESNRQNLNEIIWRCLVDLECKRYSFDEIDYLPVNECKAIFKRYKKEVEHASHWIKGQWIDVAHKCKTTAQVMALYGGQGIIECEDLLDLQQAITIQDSWNNFNHKVINSELEQINYRVYYNDNNPNNGSEFFKFSFAIESSVAIYIKAHINKYYMNNSNSNEYYQMNIDQFDKTMKELAIRTQADEYLIDESKGYSYGSYKTAFYRLWWD